LSSHRSSSTATDGPVTKAPVEEFWRVIKLVDNGVTIY
jgi:hypothetical protein